MSTVGHQFLTVNKEQFCKIVSEHDMLFGKSTFSFIRRQIEVCAVGWRLKSSAGARMLAVVLVAAGKQRGVPAC